jgi:hypothetical protein
VGLQEGLVVLNDNVKIRRDESLAPEDTSAGIVNIHLDRIRQIGKSVCNSEHPRDSNNQDLSDTQSIQYSTSEDQQNDQGLQNCEQFLTQFEFERNTIAWRSCKNKMKQLSKIRCTESISLS